MHHPRIICGYRFIASHFGHPPQLADTLEHLKKVTSEGFTAVELRVYSREEIDTLASLKEDIRDHLNQYHMRMGYLGVSLPGMSSPDRSTVSDCLLSFDKACDIAERLGCEGIINLSPLPPLQFPEDTHPHDYYDPQLLEETTVIRNLDWFTYWDNLIDTYRQACDLTAQRDMTFHLHPSPGTLVSNSDGFLYFHEEVGRNNLRIALDTANQFSIHDNLVLSILRVRDLIDVIYISDAEGRYDRHLEPGAGRVPFDRFFETLQAIRYRGRLIIDIGGKNTDIANINQAYSIAGSMIDTYLDLNASARPI